MTARLGPFLFLAAMLASIPASGSSAPFEGQILQTGSTPAAVLEMARRELSGRAPLIRNADLRLENVRHGLAATHYHFSQWIDGRRVFGSELILSVSEEGRVIRHHVTLAERPSSNPDWSREDLLGELRRRHPELTDRRVLDRTPAYRNESGRAAPIERFLVEDAPLRGTVWELDAASGEVLREIPQWASVSGRVFPANPVTTLNDSSLRDGNDSASAVPQNAYETVELLGLPQSGELSGPRVRIVDVDSPFTVRARIESGLSFERDRNEFEEVNAYHHIDRSQLYLQALGYTGARQIVASGVRVDPHANRGADNSFYSSTGSGPTILLGDGGVDDAEDPDIVLHEYGHAIHDALSPGALFSGSDTEARAISEGFGDYWAFSSGLRASIDSGRDPFCVGDWDARCDGAGCAYPAGSDCLRRVDEELTTDDFVFSSSAGTEHRNGRIWSTFGRDLLLSNLATWGEEDGRRRTDILMLEGMQGLPFNPDFDLVVEQMIDADRILFASQGRQTICTAARARRFGVPDSCRKDLRGETLVIPGVDPVRISAGSTERYALMGSDAVVRDVMVEIELADDAPEGLEIALIAPDGTRATLKQFGSTHPRSVTFGRDRLPFESLERLEGVPNPGVWTLRLTLTEGSPPVTLESWMLIVEQDVSEKIEVRGLAAGSRHFPAVAHTPGAEGTFFVSDLAIANPGPERELTLIFTPSGADGTSEFSAVRLALRANETVVLNDVVRSVFDSSGSGTIEIRGAGTDVRMSSRTVNRTADGTFGLTIPSVKETAGFGGRLIVSQIRRNLRFRTNLGLAELSGKGSEATIRVRDREGALVGSLSVQLEPFTQRQVPLASFVAVTELESAWAEVVPSGQDDLVAAYGSVVDNRTGDSVFVPAETVRSEPAELAIPAAARVPGARGTRWRTDLWIANGADSRQVVEATFFRTDGAVFARLIALEPDTSRVFPDVVGELFEAEGTGWIRFSPSRLTISSRTWNDDAAGSYGQYIGAVRLDDQASIGARAIVPKVVMDGSFRSNVGVTELIGGTADLRIEVRDGEGTIRCSQSVELGPNQHRQWSVLDLGCGPLGGGRVEIVQEAGEGRIAGYVSIVDQRTGDPSYIPAN